MSRLNSSPCRRPAVYDHTAKVIYLTGPGDDVVTEEGPLTPAVEFAHRAPRYLGEIIVITLCLGIGCFCIWEIVGIGAAIVRRVVG